MLQRLFMPFLRPLAKFQRTEGCMMSVRSLMKCSGFMKQIITVNDVCRCSLSIALSVSLFSLLFSMCLCVVFWYLNQSIYPSNLSGYVFVILLYSACLNSFWCFGEKSHFTSILATDLKKTIEPYAILNYKSKYWHVWIFEILWKSLQKAFMRLKKLNIL